LKKQRYAESSAGKEDVHIHFTGGRRRSAYTILIAKPQNLNLEKSVLRMWRGLKRLRIVSSCRFSTSIVRKCQVQPFSSAEVVWWSTRNKGQQWVIRSKSK